METTGLADPTPIIFTFNAHPVVKANYKVDAVLTLVDAKHITQHLDEVKADGAVNEAVTQVAFADKILLNKTDLVTPAELKVVKQRILAINSFAELIECQARAAMRRNPAITGAAERELARARPRPPLTFRLPAPPLRPSS